MNSTGRRRAVIVGAALAVAVAIVVPVALSLTGDHNEAGPAQQDSSSPTVSTTPSPTSTASATSSPSAPASQTPSEGTGEPQPWVVAGLDTGRPPGLPYLVGRRLHAPGQPVATIDADGAFRGARMSDGRWLVAATYAGTGSAAIELRDPDWSLLATFPGRDYEYFALSPSRDTAAWAGPDGAVVALQVGEVATTEVGRLPTPTSLVRTVRGSDCATDCVVSGDKNDARGSAVAAWEMTTGGTVRIIGHRLLIPIDATDATMIGITELTDYGSCSALLDLEADTTRWSTCDNSLVSFSPDGTRVLAADAYGDGWGRGEIAVYDVRSGRRVLDLVGYLGSQVGYQEAEWEDDTHVLVKTYVDGRWAVVRLAVDGSMEYALAPVAGNDMAPPFWVFEG